MLETVSKYFKRTEQPPAALVLLVEPVPVLRGADLPSDALPLALGLEPGADLAEVIRALGDEVDRPLQPLDPDPLQGQHLAARPDIASPEAALAVIDAAVRLQLRARDAAVLAGVHIVVAIAETAERAHELCSPHDAGGRILVSQPIRELIGLRLDPGFEWELRAGGGSELIFDDRQSLLAAPFERVFAAEINGWVRPRRSTEDGAITSPYRPHVANDLYGIALSGGGMRAGVFSLGVLQGLARSGLLAPASYVSSVSGGGYLGASLAGLCSASDLPYESLPRLGATRDTFPYAYPRPGQAGVDPGAAIHGNESPALWHVRKHAQLLGRGIGLFDRETWRAFGRYLASVLALWVLFAIPVIGIAAIVGAGIWHGIWPRIEDTAWAPWVVFSPLIAVVFVLLLNGAVALAPTPDEARQAVRISRSAGRGRGLRPVTIVLVVARRLSEWGVVVAALAVLALIVGGSVWLVSSSDVPAALLGGGAVGGGGLLAVGLPRLWSVPQARSLLTALLVVLGGYLLLGTILVAATWAAWKFASSGAEIFGLPHHVSYWGVGAVFFLGLGPSYMFEPHRLLNLLSLGDLYCDRIQQTWVISARPPRMDSDDSFDPVRWSHVWQDPTLTLHTLAAAAPVAAGEGAPYPLFCATLSLPGSQGEKLPERKGDSFVMAPFHTGSALTRWSPTAELDDFREMSLSRVSAISGAAVSSNMGEKTTRTFSIVTTLFNARLGRWVENPRERDGLPQSALDLYVKEMLALASRDDRAIYISDGGHFENLGVYELMRRRCRFIVAVSADVEDVSSEDRMGNLGNALRMARVDFGAEVRFDDLRSIIRDEETGRVQSFFAIGELHYGGTDEPPGVFVLIKSGLPEDGLTPDLLEYWRGHPHFPYDSTGDQQFDQPQFESYRQLGYLAGRAFGRHTGGDDEHYAARFQRLLTDPPPAGAAPVAAP